MVSAELKRMAQLDIPVLWRPLHEANGKLVLVGKPRRTAP